MFGKDADAALPATYQVMPGAHHGFDDTRLPAETKYVLDTIGYQKEAAEKSWKAIYQFLEKIIY